MFLSAPLESKRYFCFKMQKHMQITPINHQFLQFFACQRKTVAHTNKTHLGWYFLLANKRLVPTKGV